MLVGFELTEPPPEPHVARTEDWYLRSSTDLGTEVRGLTLQYYDGSRLWANRYDQVYRSDGSAGTHWVHLGSVGPATSGPGALVRHLLEGTRTARLLGRPHGIEGLLPLRSGTLLAVRPPWVCRSSDGGASWERVYRMRDLEPRHGLFRDWGVDARGRVWLAERGGSAGAGRLLRSDDDGATFEEAWSAPAGLAGQLRLLRVDPIRGRPWVALGGPGVKPQLGWLDSEGGYHEVGSGASWFQVSDLVFTGGEVFLFNARPRGPAGIWRYSRARQTVEKIAELGGPVVDAMLMHNEILVVSTAAAGLGEQDSQLWVREVGGEAHQFAQIPAFRRRAEREWGTVFFPAGEPVPDLRFTAERVGRLRHSAVLGTLR
jgi:hypothetical protein